MILVRVVLQVRRGKVRLVLFVRILMSSLQTRSITVAYLVRYFGCLGFYGSG